MDQGKANATDMAWFPVSLAHCAGAERGFFTAVRKTSREAWKCRIDAPMPLGPGFRIGPYEIVAVLGAGCMGEVYRAHDGRLERDVALKVLPESVAADPERLARGPIPITETVAIARQILRENFSGNCLTIPSASASDIFRMWS